MKFNGFKELRKEAFLRVFTPIKRCNCLGRGEERRASWEGKRKIRREINDL